jgi:hypothetical protein
VRAFFSFPVAARYISTWRVLDESSRLVTEAPCDAVLKENFGKFVHVMCPISAYLHAPIDAIDVSADTGTAVLERTAEMLQWQEDVKQSEKEVDGHRKTIRKYSYVQVGCVHPCTVFSDTGAVSPPT